MEVLAECCLSICVELCVGVATEAVDDESDRRAAIDARRGAKHVAVNNWLSSRFPDKNLLFPEYDDFTTLGGLHNDVYYIVVKDGIHRVSVNRNPTNIQPKYYNVNGKTVMTVSGGSNKDNRILVPPGIDETYDPTYELADGCSGITHVKMNLGEERLTIASDEISYW
eukprot:CAMPEP_0206191582 /NCGR_PEP_ID=MMETSP0166-20121206/5447_1 /ASSEMBLY_ACC=CAM_ASM_000260 /TAXON_ID=95228 /ORGANISM="Vannella robusta, Strain DIVA3 518/3/11/1/6" /LENGTH=167 /DNA_ID=CAMNT_0053607911 /DNA_START=194 /DNA_END=694 /DNA_ORIENTATION=+